MRQQKRVRVETLTARAGVILQCNYIQMRQRMNKNDVSAEAVLTQRDGVIKAEAAENLLHVPGVKEPVPSDHHLEGF